MHGKKIPQYLQKNVVTQPIWSFKSFTRYG